MRLEKFATSIYLIAYLTLLPLVATVVAQVSSPSNIFTATIDQSISGITNRVAIDQTTPGTTNAVYDTTVEPCADQTNLVCRVVGGPTRIATFSSVTSATTSSVTSSVNTGVKKFFAYMGGASETKAFNLTIFGNWQNSTTGGRFVCNIWVPSTASVTHIEATCPEVESSFPYWYYTAEVYTSASAANLTVYALH